LLDRLSNKIGASAIHRYLPNEHYWPERSVKAAISLDEEATTIWKVDRPRPLQLLAKPESIEVTAPVPDYPPMNFRYKGKLHTIKKQMDRNGSNRNGGSNRDNTGIIIMWKMKKDAGTGYLDWAL